jgi:hypothetical protein
LQTLIALMLGVYFTPRLVGYALFLPWHEAKPDDETKPGRNEIYPKRRNFRGRAVFKL